MKQVRIQTPVKRLVYSAICLALCLVLPFLTGQIPEIGNALCPMHIPVLLCGFLCGPWWGAGVGFLAPLLRSFVFYAPALPLPGGPMCFELAAYGLAAGLLYRLLPKRTVNIYISLVGAMIIGRCVWGGASAVFYRLLGNAFTWQLFVSGAVLNAVPAIICHIALIPIIVLALRKAKIL